MTDQMRVPGGTAGGTGGQFAEVRQGSNGAIRLDSPLDGTYEFPPLLTTADEAISFWARVEVPEPVCVNLKEAWVKKHLDAMLVQSPTWLPDHAWRPFARALGMYRTATDQTSPLPPVERARLLGIVLDVPGVPRMTLQELCDGPWKLSYYSGFAADVGRRNAAGKRALDWAEEERERQKAATRS